MTENSACATEQINFLFHLRMSHGCIVIVLSVLYISMGFGQSCQFTNYLRNDKYDLSPLSNSQSDYFIPRGQQENNKYWDFYINVCRALVTASCSPGSACCQVENKITFKNDHVRFSLRSSFSIASSFFFLKRNAEKRNFKK